RRWQEVRRRLFAVRAGRPQRGRDDKVVAAWNGLAVTALAEFAAVARALELRESIVDEAGAAAVVAANLLVGQHMVDGRLRRVSLAGNVGEPAGVLEDYGAVAEAFAAVHQLTADGQWLDRAGALLDTALSRF